MGPHHRQHGNNNRAPEDPYAKTKFTIPTFSGQYDAEGYLDWEMIVEQKFCGHLVPEQHRVRQATSEFKDFAIIWWNSLAGGNIPITWPQLKEAMRDHFIPPYHRELCKKLQCLEQGDKSMQDYYGELQKGLQRCVIVEDDESFVVRFYSGLRRDIQDIVGYKEFNTDNQLFQFAMLAKKELQGRETQNRSSARSSYTPRTTPSLGLPKATTFRPPLLAGKRPSAPTNGVTAAPKAPPQRPADSGKNSLQGPVQSASSVASTGRTSNIQWHCCHGLGHVQKDCPNQRAYVATGDGGYINTSDIEEDDATADDTEGHVLGGEDTLGYMNIIVQRVLSTQIQPSEKLQHHNFFQIFFVIKNR
jgi:hypothetical protein